MLTVANMHFEATLKDLAAADPYFLEFETTHWGATTGENRWADFDVVVIASLLYRPREWAANAIACQLGLAQGLNHLSKKQKGNRIDSLINSKIAVEIIQAVYRSRIRRVIAVDGRCQPADLFLMLPSDERGDQIKGMILDELPGVKMVEWDFGAFERTRKPKGTDQLKEAAFLRALEDLPPGRTPLSESFPWLGSIDNPGTRPGSRS